MKVIRDSLARQQIASPTLLLTTEASKLIPVELFKEE
jgi:hypothetical protein